ncbi:hypothetical protein SAMN04488036_103215 [Shimia haliotis]|uniref:Uncharacterized protein n=1 Tax=Shimia haliotis TaxID=1280847 RepID=A0A1I4DMV1_9RHOB|nr:hypothetical protein SAMN04488036_103215 [Shimia haliotis]
MGSISTLKAGREIGWRVAAVIKEVEAGSSGKEPLGFQFRRRLRKRAPFLIVDGPLAK